MDFIVNVLNYVKDAYTERLPYFPENIRDSLLIILFCLIATVEVYAYISYRRIHQTILRRQEQTWKTHISNMLANLIIFDDSEHTDEIIDHFYPKFRRLPLKNKNVQKILTAEIIAYHKNFTGQLLAVLSGLFRKLELDKMSRAKLRNKNWEIKIEGIREANEMGITEMAAEIIKYTDDENSLLRMEAQAAYIKLSKTDPFHFLDRAQERILDWHQLVLFEIITKNKALQIPSFSNWLRSPNDTVVMLCLKLIEHFMQFDAAEEVQRLLKHHNPKVVKKSVEVIGTLELSNAEEHIFEIFFDHNEEIKLQILNALGKISSGNYDDFLASRIYSNDVKVKREALYAIKRNSEYGDQKLKEIFKQTTLENQAIIKHVLDDRIKQ